MKNLFLIAIVALLIGLSSCGTGRHSRAYYERMIDKTDMSYNVNAVIDTTNGTFYKMGGYYKLVKMVPSYNSYGVESGYHFITYKWHANNIMMNIARYQLDTVWYSNSNQIYY
jgi:hypothetical protein